MVFTQLTSPLFRTQAMQIEKSYLVPFLNMKDDCSNEFFLLFRVFVKKRSYDFNQNCVPFNSHGILFAFPTLFTWKSVCNSSLNVVWDDVFINEFDERTTSECFLLCSFFFYLSFSTPRWRNCSAKREKKMD